jgi:hypothetical protein
MKIDIEEAEKNDNLEDLKLNRADTSGRAI